jgi:hypothetical protein
MTPTTMEMHLRDLRQLFDSMDPSPFFEKDLDPNAEEYIVESAKELPAARPCTLVIHLDQPPALSGEEQDVGDAIRVHFQRRAKLLHRDLRQLLRRGLISLGIGFLFLLAVFLLAQLVNHWLGDTPWERLLREGLIIVGWVAMWRPLEIFLYDWWPIFGEQRLHERLSNLHVRLITIKP